LRNRSWEGTDGQKHFRTEVIASRVTFLDRQGSGTVSDEKSEDIEPDEGDVQDLPFS
jgi:single-strand DNA-binding protein